MCSPASRKHSVLIGWRKCRTLSWMAQRPCSGNTLVGQEDFLKGGTCKLTLSRRQDGRCLLQRTIRRVEGESEWRARSLTLNQRGNWQLAISYLPHATVPDIFTADRHSHAPGNRGSVMTNGRSFSVSKRNRASDRWTLPLSVDLSWST